MISCWKANLRLLKTMHGYVTRYVVVFFCFGASSGIVWVFGIGAKSFSTAA